MDKSDMNVIRAAVTDMDCVAGAAFEEIASIARMSLCWLESPDGQRDLEAIASVFNGIVFIAQNAREIIGLEAERVGCAYRDLAQENRIRVAGVVKEARHA